MDLNRRKFLATGAAAMSMAAVRRVFGQQTARGAGAMAFYEKSPVRIRYEEAGSGIPLLLIPGGGLNSVISGLAHPFDSFRGFNGEYRCIAADPRNAKASMFPWKEPQEHIPVAVRQIHSFLGAHRPT